MHAMYIMDIVILCAVASYAARLQIIVNPPYLSASMNKGSFISELMDSYKKEPGGIERLQERKNWLDDDYVKFIRWAQFHLRHTEEAIFAYINPHGWIENGGFRGMRWFLMSEFSDIYILNLHGNSKNKKHALTGQRTKMSLIYNKEFAYINLYEASKSEEDTLQKSIIVISLVYDQ